MGGQASVLPAPAADPGARLRDPPPRRGCRRHGHRVAQPARGQRLQGLRRRRLADRPAGRRPDRRPRSRRSASVASVPLPDDGWHTPRRLGARRLPRRRAHGRAAGQPREVTVVHTALHGVGSETVRQAFLAAGFAGADPGGVAGRARPDVPDGLLPQPRGARRDGCRPRAGGADLTRRRHRQRPGRRPLRRRRARPRRLADAARRRGRARCSARTCCLVARPVACCRTRPTCVFANSIVSSRLLAAMCRAGGGAARGDAHRVQVDRPGARAALRLRGGARLLRRPGPGA